MRLSDVPRWDPLPICRFAPVSRCGKVVLQDWSNDFSGSELHHYSLSAALQVLVLLRSAPGLDRLNALEPQQVHSALSSTRLDGRFQQLTVGNRLWILDVAHNLNAAVRLLLQLRSKGVTKLRIIYATYDDKPREQILALFNRSRHIQVAEWTMTSTSNSYLRGVCASQLVADAHELGMAKVRAVPSQLTAVKEVLAASDDTPVFSIWIIHFGGCGTERA